MSDMQGQCHCGKNTFSVKSEPESEFQFICYCTDCRVINGGGRLCGLMVDEARLSGADHTKVYSYEGGSGSSIVAHFCPDCGTHLYGFPTKYPGKVVIKANTLIDAQFTPQQPLFAESAFAWDKIVAAS